MCRLLSVAGCPAILVSLFKNVLVFIVFLCFYAANFAMNIKTPQISELHKCCSDYQNVANFATILARNRKCCKVKDANPIGQCSPS